MKRLIAGAELRSGVELRSGAELRSGTVLRTVGELPESGALLGAAHPKFLGAVVGALVGAALPRPEHW